MTTTSAHKPERMPVAADVTDSDTLPDTDDHSELLEAIEWLKKAGVVQKNDRPAFVGFFEEVVNSKEGEAVDVDLDDTVR
ncbi:MAG TPA: hypothetical protein VGO62_01555 [Myxococcota bacterium]